MTSALLSVPTNPPPSAGPRRHARAPLTITGLDREFDRGPDLAGVLLDVDE